jgi:hypothetical protein
MTTARLTCPGCARGNDPKRRYCGGCGCSLVPICRSCQFSNESDDRFCGGCGSNLIAASAHAPELVRAAPAIAPAISAMTELGDLFAPSATASLTSRIPKVGVGQDDLDLLFGDPQ